MHAILSMLFVHFIINYISRDLDNTKILLYKFFVRHLVVKPACVNAPLAFYVFNTQRRHAVSRTPMHRAHNRLSC